MKFLNDKKHTTATAIRTSEDFPHLLPKLKISEYRGEKKGKPYGDFGARVHFSQ
jgi:hypothetical protein